MFATSIKIGVLAHKNYQETTTKWQEVANYLNSEVAGYEFLITALKFEEFAPALRDKTIDFLVLNSSFYVELENKYGISRIATLKNIDLNGAEELKFGGVIFTHSNQPISSLKDLKGVKFAAVDNSSFGGYIMALRELKAYGITENDLKTTFYGTHERVVYAVLDSIATAGTVRTDTLERMLQSGKITLDQIKVLNPKSYPDFPYLISTRLYPEWPVAKTNHISNELAEKVAIALISMPKDSKAARSIDSTGFTIPLDYQEIHDCLRELELGPYSYLKEISFVYFVKRYYGYIIVAILVALLLAFVVIYVLSLNSKLQSTRDALKKVNLSLEKRVSAKTAHLKTKNRELEEQFKKEQFLRDILRTVADVNQLLITSQTKEELLSHTAEALIANKHILGARITLIRDNALMVFAKAGLNSSDEITSLENMVFLEKKEFFLQNPEELANRTYALPLKSSSHSSEVLGVFSIYASIDQSIEYEVSRMIIELSGDIGFAVAAFDQRVQIESLHDKQLRSYNNFIDALVDLIEKRDTYTAGHTARVASYATLIAKELGLSKEEIKELQEAARLHDIGKVVTPDSVLLKPDKLNTLEFELIKEHVEAGKSVLESIEIYRDLASVVADHHEKYDGTGYPKGKSGDEISLLAYIIAVADAFDAMTTNRIYKPRKEVNEALKEIESLAGKWYHPIVALAATKALKNIEVDSAINQLGETALDEERLSYFFKDRLTKLYSEEYLSLTLKGRSKHPKPSTLVVISLNNFKEFNREFGWNEGNLALIKLAKFLQKSFPNALMFRIWGDRFVIADQVVGDTLENSPLIEQQITYRISVMEKIPDTIEELSLIVSKL